MGAGIQRWWRVELPPFEDPFPDHYTLRVTPSLRSTGVTCSGCGVRFFDAHYCEHTAPYTVVIR